jgi:hypothetical protein
LTKQKNIIPNSSNPEGSNLQSLKKTIRDKLTMQAPMKIKRFEIKSSSKTKENLNINSHANFVSNNDVSKIPVNETDQNMNTIPALNTVNNNISIYKENTQFSKEITDLVLLINSCGKEESKKNLKILLNCLRSCKNIGTYLGNEIIVENLNSLFGAYFQKFRFKSKQSDYFLVLENELFLSKTVIIDELLLNDENNVFKIKHAFWGELMIIYDIILLVINGEYDTYKKLLKEEFLIKVEFC